MKKALLIIFLLILTILLSYSEEEHVFGQVADWPPIVPPEPHEVEGSEDPTAVEIFDVATRKVTQLPSQHPTQQLVKPDLHSTPPYQGSAKLPSGAVSPLDVFLPDDRVRITPTTSYPWRTVVKLFATGADGITTWSGSGAIISTYYVLTAGHVVYDHDTGGWASSVEVVPALDDEERPYGSAWASKMRSYTGWTQDQDHRHDWALVTLNWGIGGLTGWMGRMTADPTDPVYTGALNTAGYPGDLGGGLQMYWDSDNGRTADEHNHWYFMDTAPGQSGSPVWVYYPDTDQRYILTIHAYGDDGSGSNHGTRLNQDKFDRIIAWMRADGAGGGVVIPVDKFGLLAPYISVASTILVATVATSIFVKRVKNRKEKQ